MKEIWKDIPEFMGDYQASNTGKIKSLSRLVKHPKGGYRKICERLMKIGVGTNGYLIVGISKNGVTISKTIHRLIASAFHKNPLSLPEVNHIDGDKKNNNPNNLEWVSTSENRFHAFRTGLQRGAFSNKGKKGELCSNSKPVIKIHKNGYIEFFASATTAEEEISISRRGISQCARGLQDYAGGFKWIYA